MIDFNKLIDNFLVREYKPKSIGKYYPSEIGGCLRKTYFSYKNPKKVKAELLRIFEAGNMLHEFITEVIKSEKITEVIKSEKNKNVELLKSEMPVKVKAENFVISGRVDNLMLLKVDNKKVLVEVKSTKFLPKKANPGHEMQLQFYMYSTKIHRGLLLYVQKDNLQVESFNVKYNKRDVEGIMKRFELLHNSLEKNKIPEPEAKLDKEKNWMCKYCDYKDECEKINNLTKNR